MVVENVSKEGIVADFNYKKSLLRFARRGVASVSGEVQRNCVNIVWGDGH